MDLKFTDLMLDLETMDNRSYAAIVSIGMVPFNLFTGKTGNPFYVEIDLESCLRSKLRIGSSTILWWLKQNDIARGKICDGTKTQLKDALTSIANIIKIGKYSRIWGNGTRFDLGILENAYHACNLETPWMFWQEMDLRTLVALAPEIKKGMQFDGVAHSPVDDCLHQIKYCVETFKRLSK